MACATRDIYGLACPECGSSDDLVITLSCFARLTAEGPKPRGPLYFNEDTKCLCDNCKESGPVEVFIESHDLWNRRP